MSFSSSFFWRTGRGSRLKSFVWCLSGSLDFGSFRLHGRRGDQPGFYIVATGCCEYRTANGLLEAEMELRRPFWNAAIKGGFKWLLELGADNGAGLESEHERTKGSAAAAVPRWNVSIKGDLGAGGEQIMGAGPESCSKNKKKNKKNKKNKGAQQPQ